MVLAIKVPVIESEKGWGQKIDDYMVCKTVDDAVSFVSDFNSKNTEESVPDWYMYADVNHSSIELTPAQEKFLEKENRVWLSQLKNIV